VLFPSEDRPSIDFMMEAWEAGAIDGVLTPFTLTNQIGEFPTASPLVRLQIETSGRVTNQKSEPVQLNALMRFVAGLLDGRHDRAALAEKIAREVDSKSLGADLQSIILNQARDSSELTEECLRYFRDHALLINQMSHT
jgi:methyltransferase-like protein